MNRIVRPALTMPELLITIVIGLILIGTVGTVMSDSWRTLYRTRDRMCSDVYEDSYVIRRFFEALIRKSSSELIIEDGGQSIVTSYYASDESTFIDRYARLFVDDNLLYVEYGTIDSDGDKVTTEVKTICENVSSCTFSVVGDSAQMSLELDDGNQRFNVFTSAVAHN